MDKSAFPWDVENLRIKQYNIGIYREKIFSRIPTKINKTQDKGAQKKKNASQKMKNQIGKKKINVKNVNIPNSQLNLIHKVCTS